MPGGVPRRERKKRKEIRKEELQRLEHKSARIYVGVMRIGLFTLKKKKKCPLWKKKKSDYWHPRPKPRQLMPRRAKGQFFSV